MFHRFVSFVHLVNTGHNPEFQPWTDREKEILDFMYYQLSYYRPLKEQEKKFPILLDKPEFKDLAMDNPIRFKLDCLVPVRQWEDGEQVLGLDDIWIKFLEEQIPDFGKYLGTVTFSGKEEPIMGCPTCGEDFIHQNNVDQEDEDAVEQLVHKKGEEHYTWDMDGVLKWTFHMDEQKFVELGECSCPKCGETVKPLSFEEGPDVDTLWIFEKGSISYSHYGRGAGMSARFHENCEVTGDPVQHYKDCRTAW